MADMPRLKPTKLAKRLDDYVNASEAVREGIATHAQKHVAALRAAREKIASNRKLTSGH